MGSPTSPIDQTTYDLYQKGEVDAAYNTSPALGMTKQKGGVELGAGQAITWTALAANIDNIEAGVYDDNSEDYVPKNLNVQPRLNWGRLRNNRALPGWDMQIDNSPVGGTDVSMKSWKQKNVPEQIRALLTQGDKSISYQLLQNDGETNSTNAPLPMMGLPTIFRPAAGTANTDKEATVSTSATYAGLNLGLNSLTGLDDTADPYAWTPRLFNTNYDWDQDGTTETDLDADNFPFLIDEMEMQLTFGNMDSMRPDCILVDKVYYTVARNFLGQKQSIYIDTAEKGNKKWGLGTNAFELNHNGLDIYWDSNMPASTGYMLNFDQIKIMYLDPNILMGQGDKYGGDKSGGDMDNTSGEKLLSTICTYNDQRIGWNSACVFGGQFQFMSPKYQGRFTKETA